MQMLMANMMHETCNFVYMKEIADGWAYEGRTDLGNTSPGDGPKYKGAGVLQLTGKFNYSRLAEGLPDPKVMALTTSPIPTPLAPPRSGLKRTTC